MAFSTNKLIRAVNEITSSTTPVTTPALMISGNVESEIDEYYWAVSQDWTLYSWVSLFTPLDGESGELFFLLVDTADSNKVKVSYITYEKAGGTVTFGTPIHCGSSTVQTEVQNSSGEIQFRHNTGANRVCTIKARWNREF